jgi:hypothetical protein
MRFFGGKVGCEARNEKTRLNGKQMTRQSEKRRKMTRNMNNDGLVDIAKKER